MAIIGKFPQSTCKTLAYLWRDGRVVDGGGLENRCGVTHRGFESLSLRSLRSLAIGIRIPLDRRYAKAARRFRGTASKTLSPLTSFARDRVRFQRRYFSS